MSKAREKGWAEGQKIKFCEGEREGYNQEVKYDKNHLLEVATWSEVDWVSLVEARIIGTETSSVSFKRWDKSPYNRDRDKLCVLQEVGQKPV